MSIDRARTLEKKRVPIAAGVGVRLREARLAVGRNQGDFAALCGLTQSYVSEIESGKAKPSIEAIAGAMQLHPRLSLRYILFGIGDLFRDEGQSGSLNHAELLEALLIRASREQAAVPPSPGQRDLDRPEFRAWLSRNMAEQLDMLGATAARAFLVLSGQAEDMVPIMDENESALQAAMLPETRDMPKAGGEAAEPTAPSPRRRKIATKSAAAGE
jgi:transcriptional regulator with XRE-family HTH domain